MGQTATEKMLENRARQEHVSATDTVEVDVDLTWVHETQLNIFRDTFEELGGEVFDTEKAIFMIDHFPIPTNDAQAERLDELHAYADSKGIDVISVGIKHQAWRMLGLAYPGAIMCGPDSHTPTAGALGAFAASIGPTDTAVVWNTGKLWLKVPETIRFDVRGELDPYVTPRDVGFHILDRFGEDNEYFAESKTIEYGGPTIERMGLDGRQTLCNMATEMGVTNAFVEPDDTLVEEYLRPRVEAAYELFRSDDDATFAATHEVDVDGLTPKVAYPHSPSNVRDVREAVDDDVHLDQVFVGSCANGHLSDLAVAAELLEGEQVHEDVTMYVTPATDEIRKQASAAGYLDVFTQAGAKVSPGYCSVCPGYEGVLAEGQVCLSTSTRNYKGRMGSPGSEIYLSSPAVAAASAIAGKITSPV